MYYLHCVDNILLLFYGYILKQCCLFEITFSSSLPPLSHCLPSMTYHLLPLPLSSLLPGTGGMADLRAGVDKLPEQVQDHPRMG